MATYNAATTVQEALDSLAAQTYENWDLVVCDDASTDETVSILEAFAAEHPERVTILHNEVNSKLAFSLNHCLQHVSGDLVARMDADDLSVAERFEKQVAYLLGHPDVSLVGTAMQRFDNAGLKDILTLQPDPDRWSMRHGVPFAHATVMVRRETYQALGGYTVSKRTERGQDYDLWFRFFANGFKGTNLIEPLYQVREDAAAIKRRTFQSRWRTFQTAVIGFRELGYPLRWYVYPVLQLVKGFAPVLVIEMYRKVQQQMSSRKAISAA